MVGKASLSDDEAPIPLTQLAVPLSQNKTVPNTAADANNAPPEATKPPESTVEEPTLSSQKQEAAKGPEKTRKRPAAEAFKEPETSPPERPIAKRRPGRPRKSVVVPTDTPVEEKETRRRSGRRIRPPKSERLASALGSRSAAKRIHFGRD